MTPPERLQDVTLAERLLEMCREPDGTEMPGHAEPWGADVATLREAAAALSVRGDSLTGMVNGYLPRQQAIEIKADAPLPDWLTRAPYVRVTLYATPPSEG